MPIIRTLNSSSVISSGISSGISSRIFSGISSAIADSEISPSGIGSFGIRGRVSSVAEIPGRVICSSGYSRISVASPFGIRTETVSFTMFRSDTVPGPSGVITSRPIRGIRFRTCSYWSCSYFRQHISLPHKPLIFVGFRERFWSLAIRMETGWKSFRNEPQQIGRPQGPSPPSIRASSRTPICRSSIRVRKTAAKSLTSARKSTRPFAVK